MTERDVFITALQMEDLVQRSAYLDEACVGQPELRQRVDALFQAFDQVDSFMQQPAAAMTAAAAFCANTIPHAAESEALGASIGPYKLLEQIGEGGMGTVYMAEQVEPVRRKVALKVIKPGMDSRQVIARFEAERQALALMDHPNIAKVLDAGTIGVASDKWPVPSGEASDGASLATSHKPLATTAWPYFVMELVRGLPITEFCDSERLSIKQRLELFTQVCRAVQHAHQKGIIHRDIKPTNVLVTLHDGVPVPKVIDFGVAKAVGHSLTDKTLHTGFLQMVGTPLYMSPEQAELSGLDVDTRSDIYSLGVLLYELLTGTTPFDRETFRTAALDEVRRIIREVEPPTPSTRFKQLAMTIDTIPSPRAGQRGLIPSPLAGERGLIPSPLAGEGRVGGREPIPAPPSGQRGAMPSPPAGQHSSIPSPPAGQRGPIPSPLAGEGRVGGHNTGTPPTIAHNSTSESTAAHRSTYPRKLANTLRGELDWIVMKALEKDRRRRYETANDFASDVMRYLTDQPVEACPPSAIYRFKKYARRHRVALLTTALVGLSLIAGAAVAAWQAVEAHRARDEALMRRQQARQAVDEMFSDVAEKWLDGEPNMTALQEQFLRNALRFYQGFASEPKPHADQQYETAMANQRMARLQLKLRQPEQAETAFRQAIALLENVLHSDPQAQDARYQLAVAFHELGRLHWERAQFNDAETAYRRAIAMFEAYDLSEPGSQRLLAKAYNNMASLMNAMGRREDAERFHQRTLSMREQLYALLPEDSENRSGLGAVLNNIANRLIGQGRAEDALPLLESAVEHQCAAILSDRRDPIFRMFLYNHLRLLGRAFAMTGKHVKADHSYRRALAEMERLVADFPEVPQYRRWLAVGHTSLAIQMAGMGYLEDSIAHFQSSAQIFENLIAERPNDHVFRSFAPDAHLNLAMALKDLNRIEQAATHVRRAIEIRDNTNGIDWLLLAILSCRLGSHDEAREWYTKAISWMDQNPSRDEDLLRLRAEADLLIGADDLMPTGTDAFAR